jgi:hypothetical protein
VFLVRDFQWVRDFPLGYHDDLTGNDEKNYKIKALSQHPKRALDANFIREQISLTFPQIGIYLLPYPGTGLAVNYTLDNLEPEFSEHVQKFTELTFQPRYLVPKTIGGQLITATKFKTFVQSWTNLFGRNDGIPTVQSIYDTTAQVQHIIALKDASTYYDTEMKKFFDANTTGVAEASLNSKHLEIAKKSEEIFKSVKKLGGKRYDERFCQQLEDGLESRRVSYLEINSQRIAAAAEKKRLEKEIEERNREKAQLKRNFEEFQSKSDAKRKKLESDLDSMRVEMNKSVEANAALSSQYGAMASELERVKTDGQNQMREYQRRIDETNERARQADLAHQRNMLALQQQLANIPRPKKSRWWEGPLSFVTMGLSSKVLDKW